MSTDHAPVILVVEDETSALVALTRCIQSWGYRVVPASNGLIALACTATAPDVPLPDVVVCDIAMPVMTGLQLAKRLRASERTRHIPIIFLTARDDAQTFVDGMRSGDAVVAYLHKPVDIDELRSEIERALRRGAWANLAFGLPRRS